MATREEKIAAKEKMEEAEAALITYADRSSDVDDDPALHRMLTEQLRKATEEFLEAMK